MAALLILLLVLVAAGRLRVGLAPLTQVQPILPNRHARGLSLDARVLESCGCREAINREDPLQMLRFFCREFRSSVYLFIEKAPWWVALLPKDRVWILWNHEILKTYPRLRWAGRILCKTEVARQTALAQKLDAEVLMVGFTSWSEPVLELEEPASRGRQAHAASEGVLHVGGSSGYKQTRQVLEAWLSRPDFPLLTVVCFWGCRERLCQDLILRALRAQNIRFHQTPLPQSQLDRYLREIPIHLHTSSAEGFGHSLNHSRRAGAVIVATGAPPMSDFANIPIACTTSGVWNQISAAAIVEAVELALRLEPNERLALGLRNQRAARAGHHAFLHGFADFLQRHGLRRARPTESPLKTRRVHFFMGRLPARTGGERYNELCIEALRNAGYPTSHHWVSPYRSASLIGLLPRAGALLCSPFLALFFAWRSGLFIVDEHFLAPLALTNRLRQKWRRGALVVVVHHMDHYSSCRSEAPPGGAVMAYHRWLLEPADRLITVSRFSRDELVSLGVPESKVSVVAPGFEAGPHRPRKARDGPLRCLVVGRCEPRKDWETLLLAVARLAPSQIQVRLAGPTGSPHFRDVVEPLHRRLDLADRVRFEGALSRDELEARYADSDVLVHPSRQEGFGIVLLEAMSRGLPVVSTFASSIPELVEPGRDGMLYPVGDVDALAAILHQLCEQPDLLKSLTGQSEEKAAAYTWPRTQRGFLEALRQGELLGQAGAGTESPR